MPVIRANEYVKQTPNLYSTGAETTDNAGTLRHAFGFVADHVLLVNDGTVPVYFTLRSCVATTADAELRAGESLAGSIAPTAAVGLQTTTTATTTGNDVRLVAWGA